jgi:hypothetical protein
VARTGRAYRRIIVQFGGMATIRVTTRTHLFAFKSCAIQQTTHIVKLGFHAGPRTLLPLKRWHAGPPSQHRASTCHKSRPSGDQDPIIPFIIRFHKPSSARQLGAEYVDAFDRRLLRQKLGAFAPPCASAGFVDKGIDRPSCSENQTGVVPSCRTRLQELGDLPQCEFSLGCHGFIVPPSFDPHRLHPRLLVSASA